MGDPTVEELRRDAARMTAHPVLSAYAEHLERLQWAAFLLDDQWRLAWVSQELREFLQAGPDADLGEGRHVAEALLRQAWLDTVSPDSQVELFTELAPYFANHLRHRRGGTPPMREELAALVAQAQPVEAPPVWSTSFQYIDPRRPDTGDYQVNILCMRVRDDTGADAGVVVVFYMAVRPNLLALLGRGDQAMYERMARLVEPGRREAAILFCDLHGSGTLSRRLPTAMYFRLVRSLWSTIDQLVAEHTGIVGKHAGDGATAFFLVEDLGGASAAASAAVRTARRIHELSAKVFAEVADSDCLMRVGIHWGASLYMGQLVPGGRLDVTALGDEVNEAARIQDVAGPHETLASKQLVERLSQADARALDVEPEHLSYRLLADLAGDRHKVLRDAGAIAVTAV